MNKVQLLLANKHTTGAAAVFFLAKLAALLGGIWFPHQKEQFDQTAQIFENAAIGWGLLFAGDAKPVNGHSNDEKSNSITG